MVAVRPGVVIFPLGSSLDSGLAGPVRPDRKRSSLSERADHGRTDDSEERGSIQRFPPGFLSPTYTDTSVLNVAADAGQTVNLALEGLDFRGPGMWGLKGWITGNSAELDVSMKNCIVESFTEHGIYFVTMAGGRTIVEVEETVVRDNIQEGVSGQGGAGMRVSVTGGSAAITLHNSRLLDNRCLSAGGGLFFQLDGGTTTARLENSIVAGNHSHSSSEGGGMYILSTNQGRMDLNLTNTTIFNNTAASFGGGLCIVATPTA